MIQHLGTPVDVLLQEDLLDERAQQYQVYLFANASRMEPPIRRIVREKLQRDGKTLVWFYAPGYIGDAGLSTEAMRDLTGIQLGIDDVASEMIVRVDNRTHAITKELDSFGVFFQGWVFANFERHFGTHRPVRPLFFADDSQAEPLGYYTSILKTALGDQESRRLSRDLLRRAVRPARAAAEHLPVRRGARLPRHRRPVLDEPKLRGIPRREPGGAADRVAGGTTGHRRL